MLKKLTLAAFAATLLAGSAALAHAESNVSGIDGAGISSLQNDWAGGRGAGAYSMAPSESTNAYSYAPERRVQRLHRNSSRMNHHN